jgi:hypothetical protein
MSLQTRTMIRVHQRKLWREAKEEFTPLGTLAVSDLFRVPNGEASRRPDAGNPHVRFDERG